MIPSTTTTAMPMRLKKPGRLTIRAAIQAQKRRKRSTPVSAPRTFPANPLVSRRSSTPSSGRTRRTVSRAMIVAKSPASPNARMRSDCENRSAMNDRPAVACVSTQAGPTIASTLRKAVYLSSPAISRSRAANVSCIESAKLITMISGVITFRNMLRRKLNQPNVPSASRMAINGGAAAMIMNEMRRKNRMASGKKRDQAARAVDQLQIGDGVAQLFDVFAREQVLGFDDDEHVVFGGGKPADCFLELTVFRRVGTEELAQGIVDLEPRHAEAAEHREHDENDRSGSREAQRDQAQPLDAERQRSRRFCGPSLHVHVLRPSWPRARGSTALCASMGPSRVRGRTARRGNRSEAAA